MHRYTLCSRPVKFMMFDQSLRSHLSTEPPGALMDVLNQHKVVTLALDLMDENVSVQLIASKLGGAPCIYDADWPSDKNGNAMVFWAQINFEEIRGTFEEHPTRGVLMAFLSPNYQSFRPKETGWFRLLYDTELEGKTDAVDRDNAIGFQVPPQAFSYIPATKFETVLASVNESLRSTVENWLVVHRKETESRLKGAHQILGIASQRAEHAKIMASFYANGVSFDEKRMADSCYRHLVDDAVNWTVLWKMGNVVKVSPNEARELFICMRHEDLIKLDFIKSVPIFL